MVLRQNDIYFELFDKYFDFFAVNFACNFTYILLLFTNSTSGLPVDRPEVVGSSIEELVSSLLDDFSVTVVGVCHVIPRSVSFPDWEDFLQRAEILNNYVRVVLEPFPNAFVGLTRIFLVPLRICT